MVDISNMDPRLLQMIEAARKATGAPLSITSGYRSPGYNRKVGGAGKSYHTRGQAADVDLSGLDDAARAKVVNYLREVGGKGFITYDKHPDMLHVDLRAQERFMHNKSARNMAQAPQWFQKLAGMTLGTPGATGGGVLAAPAPQQQGGGLLSSILGNQRASANFPAAPVAPVGIPDGPKGQEMLPVAAPQGLPDMAGSGLPPQMNMAGIEGALGKMAGAFQQGRDPQAEAHAAPIQSSIGASDDAGRMAAGQQLMAQILAAKKKIPGMSLMG